MMLRTVLSLTVAVGLLVAPAIAAQQQQHGSGHPSGGSHPAFGSWHSAGGHSTPISHGAVHPPQGQTAPIAPNQTRSGTSYYRGTTHYSSGQALNASYARDAASYPGGAWVYGNGGRWYNGYWHSYWANADWVWFDGFYGFWFPLDGATVFVYESAPGVCEYWDGSEWVPYYDPDTGYYCPY